MYPCVQEERDLSVWDKWRREGVVSDSSKSSKCHHGEFSCVLLQKDYSSWAR